MTAATALQQAAARLTAAGVDTPRLDAQLLLLWVLKCRREDLARAPERGLSGREQLIFDKAVALRAQRRPLPYITGEQAFYGRIFNVSRAVLIPRPETETLVTAALENCRSQPCLQIADIGTGSGCLAVSLACERPDAQIWATDISADALTLAGKNVARYKVQDQVTLLQGDLLSPLPRGVTFDLIVSNPPYITEAEYPDLQPEVRDYEPRLALTGEPEATGGDGTWVHRRLLSEARRYLKPGGRLMLEVGLGQPAVVAGQARAQGYPEVSVQNDFAGIPRIVLAQA